MFKVFITSTITIPLLEKPVTIFPSNKQGFNHYLEPSNYSHHCMTWSFVWQISGHICYCDLVPDTFKHRHIMCGKAGFQMNVCFLTFDKYQY